MRNITVAMAMALAVVACTNSHSGPSEPNPDLENSFSASVPDCALEGDR